MVRLKTWHLLKQDYVSFPKAGLSSSSQVNIDLKDPDIKEIKSDGHQERSPQRLYRFHSLIPLNKALIMDMLSAECAHVAAAGSLPADI